MQYSAPRLWKLEWKGHIKRTAAKLLTRLIFRICDMNICDIIPWCEAQWTDGSFISAVYNMAYVYSSLHSVEPLSLVLNELRKYDVELPVCLKFAVRLHMWHLRVDGCLTDGNDPLSVKLGCSCSACSFLYCYILAHINLPRERTTTVLYIIVLSKVEYPR